MAVQTCKQQLQLQKHDPDDPSRSDAQHSARLKCSPLNKHRTLQGAFHFCLFQGLIARISASRSTLKFWQNSWCFWMRRRASHHSKRSAPYPEGLLVIFRLSRPKPEKNRSRPRPPNPPVSRPDSSCDTRVTHIFLHNTGFYAI